MIGELPDIFVANYPNDPEVPNCRTGNDGDKVVVNFPNPGKYGRVLQDPVEPANKPADYCTQIPPAQSLPTFEPDHQEMPTNTMAQLTTTPPVIVIPTTFTTTIFESSSIDLAPLALGQGTNIPINGPRTTMPQLTKTPPARTIPTTFSTTISGVSSINLTPLALGQGTNIPLPSGDDTTMPRLTTTPPVVVIPTTLSTISESTSIDLAPLALGQGTNIPIPGDTTITVPQLTTTPPAIIIPTTLSTVSESTSIDLSLPPLIFPKPNKHAVACPTHGALVCLGDAGRRFGVCNWGWATPQDVAEGTECRAGEIVKRGGGEHGFIGVVMGESEDGAEGEMRRVVQDENGVPRVVMDDDDDDVVAWE
jgi:hypothetical protein